MFKEKDDIFRTLLLLAGRCIVEVQQNGEASGGISQNPKLIAEIINKIYKFWRRYPNANFIESVVVALEKVNLRMSHKLIAALKDSNSYVRGNAAEALGKIGNAEAVPELIAALKDSESYVRGYAASALGNIGNVETLKKIIYLSEIDIYEDEIFTSARTLAVRFSKQKLSFIPVYPELVRFNPILTFVKRRLRF